MSISNRMWDKSKIRSNYYNCLHCVLITKLLEFKEIHGIASVHQSLLLKSNSTTTCRLHILESSPCDVRHSADVINPHRLNNALFVKYLPTVS